MAAIQLGKATPGPQTKSNLPAVPGIATRGEHGSQGQGGKSRPRTKTPPEIFHFCYLLLILEGLSSLGGERSGVPQVGTRCHRLGLPEEVPGILNHGGPPGLATMPQPLRGPIVSGAGGGLARAQTRTFTHLTPRPASGDPKQGLWGPQLRSYALSPSPSTRGKGHTLPVPRSWLNVRKASDKLPEAEGALCSHQGRHC